MHRPPAIVLVHGLFGHLRDRRILAAFGDVEVHAPDLIGYGRHRDADTRGLTLQDQAAHLAGCIRDHADGAVHLVGHSVGGAVCALVCRSHPELVASFTSVEGNFTLEDAFWSRQIATKPDPEVAAIVAGYERDPDAWIAGAGVPLTPWTSALARDWLANQPASTIAAQARAVVAATGRESYLAGFRETMLSGTPVHLVAGARSAGGWHVPDWANRACRTRLEVPGVGHLMMAEDPDLFARTVLACVASG